MIHKLLIVTAFLTAGFIFTTNAEPTVNDSLTATSLKTEDPELSFEEEVNLLYETFSLENTSMPSLTSFKNGMKGYIKLQKEGKVKNELLTIVDFSLSSSQKRIWILDMATNKVLYNTYVAHGKNTGEEMATKFSNIENSFQSSLGFYVTAETYYGANGLSLKLDGMEKEFNSNARDRYVVVHGADYANPSFIEKSGRLGRSLGCPALPTKVSKDIINLIKGHSVLFIYHPNEDYAQRSTFLNQTSV